MNTNQIVGQARIIGQTWVAGLAGVALMGVHTASAAGFALMEQNTSGLGNAYAGSAAVAEDASTIFFNSAGLTQLDRPSVVVNAAAIHVKSEFNDAGSTGAFNKARGGDGGNAGGLSVVPALYVAVPLNDFMVGGVGVNAPFGLSTEYDSDWVGRFQAIDSEVKTLNINTALAFKLCDSISLGIGLDYQTIDAELTNKVFLGAGAQAEALAKVKGSDAAWGYDVGLLFKPTGSTRLGISYRSAVNYGLTGSADFAAPAPALLNGPIELSLQLPASARLALVQKIGNAFEVLAEVSWMKWNSIPELRIMRSNSGALLKNTPEKWENTKRFALGANYQLNDNVKLRAGVALDESPVPDSTRTPRLPDEDRKWLSVGAKFGLSDHLDLDVGYTHVFVADAALDQNDGNTITAGRLLGQQETKINILGMQATFKF